MSEVDVLILDGESRATEKVVRSLGAEPRWRIHVLARGVNHQRPKLFWSRHVSSFHAVDTHGNDQNYLDAIRQAVAKTNAKLILPTVEETSLFCILHRDRLTKIARLTPLPSAESFVTAIDKARLADFMVRNGIPHPPTFLPRELGSFSLAYPLLIKPRREAGGQGISKVESEQELRQDLSQRSDREDVYLQEYIDGADMGCSVLVRDGCILAWTTQQGILRRTPYGPHSEIQMEVSASVYQVTAQLMNALKWSGVANVDFRIDSRSGQPLVLEVNGRYWGSLWASTAAGVNFPDLACRDALGETLPIIHKRAGRFVQPQALLQDLMRLRPRIFRFRWNGLSMILVDPLPEITSKLRSCKAAMIAMCDSTDGR